jgi:predicted DNA-binding ribbon-helix-helix protein
MQRTGLAYRVLRVHTHRFILLGMSSVRKTISLPSAIAERLDKEAKRRHTSVSALVTELVQQQPEQLPYAGLIEDDEDLSQKVEEILARLGH